MQKKNLATLGCSHSSDIWGTSWPDYLASSLDYNLIRAASPGAGNGFYTEKLNHILQNNNIDLVVIQLTEPSRVVLGLTSAEQLSGTEINNLNDPNSFGNLGGYTWNVVSNESNIKRITGHTIVIDDFFYREVSTSKWVDYKLLHDICAMQYMCDSFNVPCIFWSWFCPMEEMFLPQYSWLENKINYVNNCASTYIKNNKIQCIIGDSHYDSNAHARLCDEWLVPAVKIIYSSLDDK